MKAILEDIREGQEIPVLHRNPQGSDLIRFAAAAEDFARQHWDQRYMGSLGFPDVIVHGWLTLTYMCQAVTAWLPPEKARILRYDARHLRPAFPGPMVCGGKVTAILSEDATTRLELALWARDGAGETLTRGTMGLSLLQ